MAALTDAVLSSRRQQNPIWDSDTWSCPDPQRCVRCDCAITSPSTPGAGVVNFVLDNRAADCEDEDGVCSLEDDAERWFLVGCKRPYQYQPLVKGGGEFDVDHEDGDDEVEEELAVLLLEDKMTLLLPVDEDERQQQQVKATSETKKKKKKKSNSSSSDDSSDFSSSSSSSTSSDSDDSSSSPDISDSSDSSSTSSSTSSSSNSSDSSTSSDSSSYSSDDDSEKKKNKMHHPSNTNSKEKGKRGNINQNKTAAFPEEGTLSHAPVVTTTEDNANSYDDDDDDDDDDESYRDYTPMTSVLSTVVRVPQITSSHSNIEDVVMKPHADEGKLKYKKCSKKSKKHHHTQDR